MNYSLIIPAFIAGLLTFLAPCTLPLVPGYLGFISGVSLSELEDKDKSKKIRFKIFLNGLFFVIGFSLVFIILGTTAGFLGRLLLKYKIWLARIGGIFVIIFGLYMLNVFKINFLQRDFRIKMPTIFERGKSVNSLILGATFAFGWTPCVGPIVGSILTLAASEATVAQGAFLLFVFSLGLAVPFLAVAALISYFIRYMKKISKFLNIISFIGGIFFVLLGILMLTDSLLLWTELFFKIFSFIHYKNLLIIFKNNQ